MFPAEGASMAHQTSRSSITMMAYLARAPAVTGSVRRRQQQQQQRQQQQRQQQASKGAIGAALTVVPKGW